MNIPAFLRRKLSRIVIGGAALWLTYAAYAFPHATLLPTLAFTSWWLLFLPWILDLKSLRVLFSEDDGPIDSLGIAKPDSFRRALEASQIAYDEGDPSEMEKHLETALNTSRGGLDELLAVATLYRLAGNPRAAARVIEAGEPIHGDMPRFHYELARAHSLTRDSRAALEELEMAIRMDESFRTAVLSEGDFDAIRENPRFSALVHG